MQQSHIPNSHHCHPGYSHPVTRAWVSQRPRKTDLIYPVFVVEGENQKQAIPSMPDIYRYSSDTLIEFLKPLVEKGLSAILIFGVIQDSQKDETGSYALQNPVQDALKKLRLAFLNLLLITDVCLCAYTSHGHCGILGEDGQLDNQASIQRLAEVALSHVEAGAHMVAPSDMMDGRIQAIKELLHHNKLRIPVMAYSAKFCSGLYGPFRDVCKSAPSKFDRSSYQLPTGSTELALKAVERDLEEGADYVMVKPISAYLDILAKIKDRFKTAICSVYQVSGEYSMICLAGQSGLIDRKRVVMEYMESFKRAGADLIITYFTPELLEQL